MALRDSIGPLVALFLASACGFAPSAEGHVLTLSRESLELLEELDSPQAGESAVLAVLEQHFGTALTPRLPQGLEASEVDGWTGSADLGAAAELYRGQCMHCHGWEGGGDGKSAFFLTPPPTDFRQGKFKWSAVERDHPPRPEDLLRTLMAGVPFTSMPAFARLEPSQREGLAQLVRQMAMRGQTERKLVAELVQGGEHQLPVEAVTEALQDVAQVWHTSGEHILLPAEEPSAGEMSRARVARGERLFHGEMARCSSCHGDDLAGDGPAVFESALGTSGEFETRRVLDEWGNPSRPRNLRQGGFRGGSRPIDLYRRIRSGISGTIMPSAAADLTEEQTWDLVYYVLTEAGLHTPEIQE